MKIQKKKLRKTKTKDKRKRQYVQKTDKNAPTRLTESPLHRRDTWATTAYPLQAAPGATVLTGRVGAETDGGTVNWPCK